MKQTVAFGEIHDINSDSFSEVACIFHAKVEPLEAADTVGIVSHPDVECTARLLPHLVYVRTFKITVERHGVASRV